MVEVTRRKRFVFNPDEETKEMLIATFAIRKEIFEKIFKIIKESQRDTAPQHFLLVGQRGMGKTTLLLRLKYEMEDNKDLNEYLLPVRFSEEQYQIGCLPDLWEETALYLEGTHKDFTGLKNEMLTHEKEKDYERICFELLTSKLKSTAKRAVLLIDNIGDLLHKFTDQENHRFRQILMTSPYFQLIGASSHMLEHTFRYDKPFFEFFYQLKLEPIKKEDATNLMKALAEHYNAYEQIEKIIQEHPERVEVLRRITGGVPRTLVLLFEILIDSDNGSTFEDLEELTDRVSPLYKERMDVLKPQQQKIMDALARAWEPLTAGEILEQSKLYREQLGSNQISAQLKQLQENQLVEVIELGKRKKAYRIRERFFNIWYLMRHGRKNTKEQVLWLIRFLESWCSTQELIDFAEKQIDSLKKETYSPKAAFYKAMAIHAIKEVDTTRKKELLDSTEKFLHKSNHTEWAKIIHDLGEMVVENSLTAKAMESYKKGDMETMEKFLLEALQKGEVQSEFNAGVFYSEIKKNIKKAEAYYLQAIEKGDVDALFNIANLYKNDLQDYSKAEAYYLQAIEKENVNALNNIAILYNDDLKDYNKAEAYYLQAIEKENLEALYNIANLYKNDLKDYSKAEAYYLKAIEKGDADALFNIAHLYKNDLKDYSKAEAYYLKAIEKGDTEALFNIANLYKNDLKDYSKAEAYYLQAIEKENVNALNNIANLYKNDLKDYSKAEAYYLQAIEKGDTDVLFNIANLYKNDLKDYNKAEAYYLQAIQHNNDKALHNYLIMLLERNRLKDALNHAQVLFNKEEYLALYSDKTILLAIDFLAREQYHFLLKEFQKENSLLMKYLKPVYYVLAWFMQEELPGEYEKAGAEIKETVDEMIAQIKKERDALKNA